MPKSARYSKGSIIFFQGDKDENIYILQSGAVMLQSLDIESGASLAEPVKTGEFFGVKSALSKMPSLVTACVIGDSVVVSMTVSEFEKLFSSKQAITEKMLRVFSKSLRDIHKKTETLLKGVSHISPEKGMFLAAKAFYEDEMYLTSNCLLKRIIERYPNQAGNSEVKKLLEETKVNVARDAKDKGKLRTTQPARPGGISINQFSLPVFDRFTKNYKSGEVIISEFEPGETFYLIKSGEVQITKVINQKNKSLDILTTGSFFGEMAILDNSQRSASCIARTDVSCLEFNKANFKALVLSNPQIVMNLLKLFCKRIYDQNRQFKILLISEIPAKIADVFLMYDELSGISKRLEDEEILKRKFNVTLNEIAGWTALPLDSVREELSRWTKQGKISIFTDSIELNNITDMRRLVDSYYTKLKASAGRGAI